MIVLKFGGTSVRDAEWVGRALDIAEERLAEAPLLVASAMGGTTDRLVAVSDAATDGDSDSAHARVADISTDHRAALAAVCPVSHPRHAVWLQRLETVLEDLTTLIEGVLLVHELSHRQRDVLLAVGELLSTIIIAAAADARAIAVTLLDSRDLIVTDDSHGAARPDFGETERRIAAGATPRPGHLLVAQGFIASSPDGTTTTLGRGGSDFSATIFGAALGATRVEIWTDVPGIMTADPRIVSGARTCPELSYDEAAELAGFGARVIHPATMAPAIGAAIPIMVANTADPSGPRTMIVTEPSTRGLRAVAGRAGVTIITVRSAWMVGTWGYLGRLFAVFERHRVSVDLVATSELTVSLSVDGHPTEALLGDLAELGEVRVLAGRAVISVVGERAWRSSRAILSFFEALQESVVEMVSLGASDTNLSIVVDESKFIHSVNYIHSKLFA